MTINNNNNNKKPLVFDPQVSWMAQKQREQRKLTPAGWCQGRREEKQVSPAQSPALHRKKILQSRVSWSWVSWLRLWTRRLLPASALPLLKIMVISFKVLWELRAPVCRSSNTRKQLWKAQWLALKELHLQTQHLGGIRGAEGASVHCRCTLEKAERQWGTWKGSKEESKCYLLVWFGWAFNY